MSLLVINQTEAWKYMVSEYIGGAMLIKGVAPGDTSASTHVSTSTSLPAALLSEAHSEGSAVSTSRFWAL